MTKDKKTPHPNVLGTTLKKQPEIKMNKTINAIDAPVLYEICLDRVLTPKEIETHNLCDQYRNSSYSIRL